MHVKSLSFHMVLWSQIIFCLFRQRGLDSLSLLTALQFPMEGMNTHFVNKSRKIRGNVFSASELESIRMKALCSLLLKSSSHSQAEIFSLQVQSLCVVGGKKKKELRMASF